MLFYPENSLLPPPNWRQCGNSLPPSPSHGTTFPTFLPPSIAKSVEQQEATTETPTPTYPGHFSIEWRPLGRLLPLVQSFSEYSGRRADNERIRDFTSGLLLLLLLLHTSYLYPRWPHLLHPARRDLAPGIGE